jgi:hypothetical protein
MSQCSSARFASILSALFSGLATNGTPPSSLLVVFNTSLDTNASPPVKFVAEVNLSGVDVELTDPGLTVPAFESLMTGAGVNLLFQAF